MRPEGLPETLRLKKRRDFLRVQNGGRKHQMRHFLVFVAPRPQPPSAPDGGASDVGLRPESEPLPSRLGITVTRKVGKAVTRNRIKRLVREVFRRERHRLASGLDVVWVAKRQSGGVSLDDVRGDFEQLLERLDRPARSQVQKGARA